MLAARHMSGKQLFDKIFLSNLLHIAKPSRSSFAYVVKNLKVKPHEALMIDDRLTNICAAKKIGMHGIVFKNTRQFKKELQRYILI
jgi:HAD superfamily hydrolase (TIGR01509 family)